MNEKGYKKRFELQQKMISRQSEQIEDLKSEVEKLKLELTEKDEIINSITHLKNELAKEVSEVKECKKSYKELIQEIRDMKKIMNQEVFKGRWWLVKHLIKLGK